MLTLIIIIAIIGISIAWAIDEDDGFIVVLGACAAFVAFIFSFLLISTWYHPNVKHEKQNIYELPSTEDTYLAISNDKYLVHTEEETLHIDTASANVYVIADKEKQYVRITSEEAGINMFGITMPNPTEYDIYIHDDSIKPI